jgi:type VI secretion system protein ImpH
MQPERKPIGEFHDPRREPVRIAANPAMAFPASQVQDLQWKDGQPPTARINLMGLTGPLGVLPYPYSDLVNERLRAKDRTLADFLDIFNHRAGSLFYRAWEKFRFPVSWERDRKDRISKGLLALIGLGTSGLADRQAVEDRALIFYTGLLGLHPRSALALAQIIEDYFEVPVAVEQFVGGWYPLPEQDQCRLGRESESEQLGIASVAGDAVWNQESRIRVKLGPIPLARYRQFLPDGEAHVELDALTRFFANGQFDFELQLVLSRTEVPDCELGAESAALPLGLCSWVKTEPFDHDPDDAILALGEQHGREPEITHRPA